MFVLVVSSLLIPCLLNVSLLIAMQLIFPEDISPEDFEARQRRPCSDRHSKTWCLNDTQPDGGCKWVRSGCIPDDSPEDFESLQRKPCSDRRSQTWCLNDFQPDGGCKWRRGQCKAKRQTSSTWETRAPRPAPVKTGTSCEDRHSYSWCTNGHGGEY